jgi:farnesyl-diphosphate farnesyltransferase
MAFTTSSSALSTAETAGSDDEMMAFLQRTSRTFALTIPMLPEPLRSQIGVAYLLFRIIDTFEDATGWPPARRVEALKDFVRLLETSESMSEDAAGELCGEGITASVARWLDPAPVAHAGYLELLAATPRVLAWFHRLHPAARFQLRQHVERSALGMCHFVERADARGALQLETLADLRQYCFVVAGIVGEMLTELFVLSGGAGLARAAGELRARSVAFGEGLQLVNILKDAGSDAADGRVYLPRQVLLAEVFVLARGDLRLAAEYTELLRASGAHRGLVAFNALNARLALAALRTLRERGPGSKLTRLQVAGLAAEVAHALDTNGPLFDLEGLTEGAGTA